MSHPQRAARVVSAVLALSLATVAPGAVGPGQAEATGNQEKYLGRWNYDQPDRASMRNVAVFYGTGFQLQIPQIGDIVFSPDTEGRIVGRTDQGCMWRFKALPDSLRLDPPSQTCHNPTSNGSYTIDTWSVTVSGRHEKEILTATSHHVDGDYEFKLENGSRTNVDEYDPRSVAQFPGVWAYDAADP